MTDAAQLLSAAYVTEGAAICAYLAAAFPEAGLQPTPGTAASADYYRWLFFAAGPVETADGHGFREDHHGCI